jgi:DNA repair photolyase
MRSVPPRSTGAPGILFQRSRAAPRSRPVARPSASPPAEVHRRVLGRLLASAGDPARSALGVPLDPYRESRTAVRTALETLAGRTSARLRLCTASRSVLEDISCLQVLAEAGRLEVRVPLPTLDAALLAKLDPGGEGPAPRLDLIAELAAAGVPVGALVAPVMPELNDDTESLGELFAAVAAASATWIEVQPMRVPPARRGALLAWIERSLPEHAAAYRRLRARGLDVDPSWRRRLGRTVGRLRRKTGLRATPHERPEPDGVRQQRLPGIEAAARGESLS